LGLRIEREVGGHGPVGDGEEVDGMGFGSIAKKWRGFGGFQRWRESCLCWVIRTLIFPARVPLVSCLWITGL
jgi:hypothetical protein